MQKLCTQSDFENFPVQKCGLKNKEWHILQYIHSYVVQVCETLSALRQ